ncbi:hypothetical protein LdCL_330039600 [Leishmania donovani]|uniref:Flagellar attachment zone protein 1 conserved domain-containing protein n=1 Tax=Leishmania donovani TaxID=5661 RepID=A0A3Q8IKH9_LEIDO|nr:hypothetical protein LdCL_330039600 [Leishmania donovani]
MEERLAALLGALVTDVAEQLSVQESHVKGVTFTASLKATFAVSPPPPHPNHHPALTRQTIDRLLGEGSFPSMRHLCMGTEAPASAQKREVPPAAAAETTDPMSTSGITASLLNSCAADAVISHHRPRFGGGEWGRS